MSIIDHSLLVCQHLAHSTRVIRVQPNLACALQCGVSAFCRGTRVKPQDVELVTKLLQTSGRYIFQCFYVVFFWGGGGWGCSTEKLTGLIIKLAQFHMPEPLQK